MRKQALRCDVPYFYKVSWPKTLRGKKKKRADLSFLTSMLYCFCCITNCHRLSGLKKTHYNSKCVWGRSPETVLLVLCKAAFSSGGSTGERPALNLVQVMAKLIFLWQYDSNQLASSKPEPDRDPRKTNATLF